MDKRTQSDLEHAFIEFVDRTQELGFEFDYLAKLELRYVKGEAALSPHNMANKITLRPEDFIQKQDKSLLNEDDDS